MNWLLETLPVSVVGEGVQQELPELDVGAVVSGPVRASAVVAVDEHLALLVLAENDPLFLGHRDVDGGGSASRGQNVQRLFFDGTLEFGAGHGRSRRNGCHARLTKEGEVGPETKFVR